MPKEALLSTPEAITVPTEIKLYEDPTNPEAIRDFWQGIIAEKIMATNKRAQENKTPKWETIATPLIPPCDRTPDELKALAEGGRTIVFDPGFSYEDLGRIFEKTPYSEKRTKDHPLINDYSYHKLPRWLDVENSLDAPNRDTGEYAPVSSPDKEVSTIQFGTYLWFAHATKKLTGEFPDTRTMTRVVVAGDIGVTSFHTEGRLGLIRYLPPEVHRPGIGMRTQASQLAA